MVESDRPESVLPVTEATFGLDGGAMFGIIPKPLWDKTNPGDEKNRIDLACRCLLIRYVDRNVLVDVGIGTKWSDKERQIYKIDRQDPGLDSQLGDQGLEASDIDDVILTHLHFDHAGGLSRRDTESGDIVPTFPEATHWVQKRNWSWAQNPSPRDEGSYRSRDFEFLGREDAPELRLIEGTDQIMPGVDVFPCNGHTFGMQVVRIETDVRTYLYTADLIPTTTHMRDPYVMGYDLQPLETVKEKKQFLHEAYKNDWVLAFEHDPETAFARVRRDDSDQFEAVPVELD